MALSERVAASAEGASRSETQAARGWSRVWLAVVVLALLGAAVVFRYHVTVIVPTGGEGSPFATARYSQVVRLDRWTGRVEVAPLFVIRPGGDARPNTISWLSYTSR